MTNPTSGDPEVAMDWAVDLMTGERFNKLACANGDVAAAQRVTEVAEVFIKWLRRPVHVTLGTPTIEEIPGGTP